MQNVIVRDEEF